MTSALLLSGGMDSIALAYWKRPQVAITIDYGQKSAAGELRSARAVATELGLQHYIETIDARSLGSGDLAGVPALPVASVPEWWPFRNQFLITIAAMRAVTAGIDKLMIGAVKSDSAHLDGTSDFVDSMSRLLAIQEGRIGLQAPAIELSTADLVRRSGVPLEVLGWAHSCHVAEYACGLCRGCQKHYSVYEELGEQPY